MGCSLKQDSSLRLSMWSPRSLTAPLDSLDMGSANFVTISMETYFQLLLSLWGGNKGSASCFLKGIELV